MNCQFQQDVAPTLNFWCAPIYKYKAYSAWGWEGRTESLFRRTSDSTLLDFFMLGYVKHHFFSVWIQSSSHIKARIELTITAVGNEASEKVWKPIKSRISHNIRVNGGHNEAHRIWIEHFEYLSYYTCWDPQNIKSPLWKIFFKQSECFSHSLYKQNVLHKNTVNN